MTVQRTFDHVSRFKGCIMSKAKKKIIDTRGPLARVLDAEKQADARAPLVNEFAAQHGCYDRNLRSVVNRGGTPIARWDKLLTPSQKAAIDHCIALWECISTSGRLVANLDRTVFGCPGDGHPREIEARSDLLRMKGHVGDRYWDVFENVVRFDEPAGLAGSRLQAPEQKREYAARLVVQFVADIITMKERLSY